MANRIRQSARVALDKTREHPRLQLALGAAGLLLFIVGAKKTYDLSSGARRVEVGERDVRVREGETGEEQRLSA